jgi:hypothetical protein
MSRFPEIFCVAHVIFVFDLNNIDLARSRFHFVACRSNVVLYFSSQTECHIINYIKIYCLSIQSYIWVNCLLIEYDIAFLKSS